MQLTPLSRFAIASALLFAIGACSDSGSGGPDFDNEATTAETMSNADDAADMMTEVTYDLNFGTPQVILATSEAAQRFATKHPSFGGAVGASIREHGITMPGLTISADGQVHYSAAVGCTITSSGNAGDPFDPYDGNANGLPDDWHVKLVCISTDTTDASNTITYTQIIEMSAKENTSGLYGYTAAAHFEGNMKDEEGNSAGELVEGSDALDIRSGAASHNYNYKVRAWDTSDGVTDEIQGGQQWNASFDPDGTIVLGDDLPDGNLTFNGKEWAFKTDSISLSFSVETTTPLSFDAACYDATNPPFTDGTVVGHLNGNSQSASFEINFTGCGTYTVAVDNTSDEPVVVTRQQPSVHHLAVRQR